MNELLLTSLTGILLLGIAAQWLAWRFGLPSILLLLVFGFVAGPATGWIRPDELFGEWLMPVVSVSVALILFEGGLTLRFEELRSIGKVVRNLVSIGALVSWIVSAVAAYWLLGWDLNLSILFGAILVVTGPTVIMPLLRHVQPSRSVGSALKWEGIVIDPIGALLAVLVFEAMLVENWGQVPGLALMGFFKTILIGVALGFAGGLVVVLLFKRYWVPDYLQNPFALVIVVGVFTLSNALQHESGLLTVTLMGLVLANQKRVAIRHIVEFKENLRVLLLSALFIVLAARVPVEAFERLSWSGSLATLGVLLLIGRPLSVLASTFQSSLNWKERLFLAWIAPRGIVAAAVASVFALRLNELDVNQAGELVPMTFLVIVGTVAIYGLTASPLAKGLKLSNPNPQGVLMVGAHAVARAIGKVLQKEGFPVILADTNRENLAAARLEGLTTYYGSILSEHIRDELDLVGIGRLFAMTPNPEVNSLATLHFIEFFGRKEVYQLAETKKEEKRKETVSHELRARILFGSNVSYHSLNAALNRGGVVKKTVLSEEFDFEAFKEFYKEKATPLFVITENDRVIVATEDTPFKPAPGQGLISLVVEPEAA